MLNFYQWFIETDVRYPDEFTVKVVSKYLDVPTLKIEGWGEIRLFYASGYEDKPHWIVHNIYGTQPGAGTALYFAALLWALSDGDKMLKDHKLTPTMGVLSCDSTLSPDAIRARSRLQTQYADYITVIPHPEPSSVKIHRNDKSDWRRPATPEEATMWRLKKMPPFKFKFI